MVSMFRHLVFFILQFGLALLPTVAGFAAYDLHKRGMGYAQTSYFQDDMHNYFHIGIGVAVLFCLVLFCYHLTRKSLDTPDTVDRDLL